MGLGLTVFGQPLNTYIGTSLPSEPIELLDTKLKIETKKFGALVGMQKGKYTMFELGVEKQWKTVKVFHPPTISANALMHYNFKNNVMGYKVGFWQKHGRIALSYGLELAYVTNFDQYRFGGGPQIGLKLLGFHIVNGYNFMTDANGFDEYNPLYLSIRYFFCNKRKYSIEKKKSFWDNFKLDRSKKKKK